MKIAVFILLIAECLSTSCKSDSDCQTLNNCVNKVCTHKDLLPIAGTEWAGAILMIMLAVIATAGGVGGSVVCTSLSLLLFYFDPHIAVAMTQAFVFAGTITTISLKFKDRHPVVDRPLIYYDAIMQLVSPLLLGVTIGVMLNIMFPGWLILALLTIVVAYLLYDITKQGIGLYKKETIKKRAQAISETRNNNEIILENRDPENIDLEDNERNEEISSNKLEVVISKNNDQNSEEIDGVMGEYEINEKNNESNKNENRDIKESSEIKVLSAEATSENNRIDDTSREFIERKESELKDTKLNKQILSIYETEKAPISTMHAGYFLFLIAFTIIISLLNGSKTTHSIINIKMCSKEYYGILAVYIIVMIGMAAISTIYLIRKNDICVRGNYHFAEGDIRWNKKYAIAIIFTGLFTGVLVGLLGLGGGYIIGPILLHMGVRPEVSTVSSSFTICISSFSALVQYFVLNFINYKYALLYFSAAIVGAFGGILGLRRIVIKIGRASVLILALSLTLFAALIIIPSNGVYNSIIQFHHGNFQLGFAPLC